MKEIVEKYVSVWNNGSPSPLTKIFSEESKYWDATQKGSAIEVLINSIVTTHEAFSEITFRIISLNSTGEDQSFLEWQMTGTNTGEFFGYPPTGKSIDIRGLDAITIQKDKIMDIKSFYDSGLFSQQLGIQ